MESRWFGGSTVGSVVKLVGSRVDGLGTVGMRCGVGFLVGPDPIGAMLLVIPIIIIAIFLGIIL